ncbi:MAG: twin-arginine translocase subunit TatC [Leptospirales bacterium]|nr:twin-arginine translocase subunit TatC [Leptospirales bacterium]
MARPTRGSKTSAPAARRAQTPIYRPSDSATLQSVSASEAAELEAEDEETDPRERYMTLGDHLEELRRRLFWILGIVLGLTVVALVFSPELHSFLIAPYKAVSHEPLIRQNAYGPMMMLFMISLGAALTVSLPICAAILWGFVTPAVSTRAARLGHVIVFSSAALFWAGLIFAWYYIAPLSMRFLYMQMELDSVSNMQPIETYYNFLFLILAGTGAAFELPLVLILLGAVGIVPFSVHRRYWRHIIVVIFVLSAVITPPEWTSQVAVGAVLLAMYAISLAIIWTIERIRGKRNLAES